MKYTIEIYQSSIHIFADIFLNVFSLPDENRFVGSNNIKLQAIKKFPQPINFLIHGINMVNIK